MSDINVSEADPAPVDESERFQFPVPTDRPNLPLWALVAVLLGLNVGFTVRYFKSRPVVMPSTALLLPTTQTKSGNGTAVPFRGNYNVLECELEVTASGSEAGDTLDVFLQTRVGEGNGEDDADWIDVIHFPQVNGGAQLSGKDGAVRHIAKIVAGKSQAVVSTADQLQAGSVRNILGNEYRVRWTIAGSEPSFMFSVNRSVRISEEINLHLADELLRDGEYSRALDIYLKHADREIGHQPSHLIYRTALCLEGTGQWEKARKKYVELTDHTVDVNFVAAADLGRARALLALDSTTDAKDVLASLWKRLPAADKSSRPYQADLHFLLALAMAWDALKADGDEDRLIAAEDLPVDGRAAFELPIGHRIDWVGQPGGESVADSAEDLPGLPENVATDDRSILEQAEDALLAAIDTYPDHPLAPMARLEYGNLAYLGFLDHGRSLDDLQTAIVLYEDMLGPKSTPTTVLAAFNQGMAYKRQREFEYARASFDRVVDGHPGSGLAPAALVQIGRMLLNQGKYEEAHMPLERAALLEAGGDVGAEAVIYLAVSLLSMENDFDTRRADDLLFRHRQLLRRRQQYRNANAFLTAYVRYRLLPRQSRRQREAGFLLNAILALGDDPVWLDSSAVLLMGRACKDLGVETLMARLYEKRRTLDEDTVSLEIEFRFHDYRYRQADINAAIQSPTDANEARKNLESLASDDEGGKWGREARIRLADIWLLEEKPDKCLEECRVLLKQVSPHREVILKLMGRAYQQKADAYLQQGELEKQKVELENAVDCFSGKVPKDFESVPEDSEPPPEQPE